MNELQVVRNSLELNVLLDGHQPGLVPTMGALHAGHAALIHQSAQENSMTVVSIFVNPTQFNDPADYRRYPRSLDSDILFAQAQGANVLFTPETNEMYRSGHATTVQVGVLADRWEGASRPGHFSGVATVVTKLLNIVNPARSYFGEKDFQQLQIIRQVHADLNLPGSITGVQTIRDVDGLALSSRNMRLGEAGRRIAQAVPAALGAIQRLIHEGASVNNVIKAGRQIISGQPNIELDYLAVVHSQSFEPVLVINPSSRVIIAVTIDGVRLIDNCSPDGSDLLPWG